MSGPGKSQRCYSPGEVLPHTSTMLLIDEIISWDDNRIETAVGSITNGMFDNGDGSTSSLICMEYLCQSAAAHAGIRQLEQGKPVTIGFIIGARKIEIDETAYRMGNMFCARVEQTFRDEEGIGVYDCALYHSDTIKFGKDQVAGALIKAVMPDDPREVIDYRN